jgi:RNA-directed DNA polymerase
VPEAKPYDIRKRRVWEAYGRVKANGGAGGVAGEWQAAFEKDMKEDVYKVWNGMWSGWYMARPVRQVEIRKAGGGMRRLGIAAVADRVSRTVVKMVAASLEEPVFDEYFYGYRPGKSTLDAVRTPTNPCWQPQCVIVLHIKPFFHSFSHQLVHPAVTHHTHLPCVPLYIAPSLRAPVQPPDATLLVRTNATPQGRVISPLLANLFLHYAFDLSMQRTFPRARFERYAHHAIVHCTSERQARDVLAAIRRRFEQSALQLHPTKTRIVYCKHDERPAKFEHIKFHFLGYTFQPPLAKNRWAKLFVSFLPAISTRAAKAIRQTIREWRMASTRNNQRLEDLVCLTNPVVRGWMNYYGRFYRSKCVQVLRHLNVALAEWARWKYKRFRRRERASVHWLGRIARRAPKLFVLWKLGVKPEAGG